MRGRPRGRENKKTPKATEPPTINQLYWAAGIYESEGCFGGEGQIIIAQKDPWILKRLQTMFGGTIGVQDMRKYNTEPTAGVTTIADKTPVKYSYICRWVISGARARGFALTMYTLLSPRRQEQIRKRL